MGRLRQISHNSDPGTETARRGELAFGLPALGGAILDCIRAPPRGDDQAGRTIGPDHPGIVILGLINPTPRRARRCGTTRRMIRRLLRQIGLVAGHAILPLAPDRVPIPSRDGTRGGIIRRQPGLETRPEGDFGDAVRLGDRPCKATVRQPDLRQERGTPRPPRSVRFRR